MKDEKEKQSSKKKYTHKLHQYLKIVRGSSRTQTFILPAVV